MVEELKQRIIAKSAKLKRNSDRIDQYRQNRLFENNQKLLFEQLEGIERSNKVIPDAEESREFWKGIWEIRISTKKFVEMQRKPAMSCLQDQYPDLASKSPLEI